MGGTEDNVDRVVDLVTVSGRLTIEKRCSVLCFSTFTPVDIV